MFCPKCGNKIPDGAQFCPKCGTKTGARTSPVSDGVPTNTTIHSNHSSLPINNVRIGSSLVSKLVPIAAAAVIIALAVFTIPKISGVVAGFLNMAKSETSVVGTWTNESGTEVLVFEENGTCSVPFTYDGAWLESCDRYAVKDDGTLVLSSSRGNIRSRTYERAGSREEALGNEGSYYLKGKELIIKSRSYERQ